MDLLTPAFGTFFWQTVTLSTVILLLGKFAWKPILKALKEREDKISATLDAAKAAEEKMVQLEAKSKTILQTAQHEGEKVVKDALKAKTAILEEAQHEAEEVGNQLIKKARHTLEQEKVAAVLAVRAEVAAMAVDATKKLLNKELAVPNAQEELLKDLTKNS